MSGALDGIRIVEVAHLVQGPQCGALLHDLGADLIKIERPATGDRGRRLQIGPGDARSPYFHANNRGKRSLGLDLGSPEGLGIMWRLVAGADVLLNAIRPGAMDRLGLTYEACREVNPALVYATASTFGPRGPRADEPGVDLIAQAYGGLASRTGSPERPTIAGATIADSAGAQMLACAILAALFSRERTGRGQRVDTSMYGSQIWAQSSELNYQLMAGRDFPRVEGGMPNLSSGGLYGIYATADGAIGLRGVPPERWDAFVDALDDQSIGDDPRFQTAESRQQANTQLREAVRRELALRSTAEWSERLEPTGIRCIPVQTYSEVERDAQAYDNGYLLEVEHPDWGPLVSVGSPIEMSETPTEPAVRAPEVGEHTREVLREVGFTDTEIDALAADGAITLADARI